VKVSANSGSFTYEAPPEEALIQRDVWIDTEDINSRNILGRTCLIDAAEFADAATLSTLIKLGVDVNAQDRNGMTALMMAANNNNSPTVISVLVQAGADVNTKDELGLTALDCALKKGTQYRDQHLDRPYTKFFFNQEINLDVVAELIKLGADVDVQDTVGMTALMMASYHNNHKLVSMLIKANADANIKDKFGLTALDCALKKETQYRDENRDFQYYWPGWEPNQEIDPHIVAELIKVTDIEMGCDHNSGVDTMVYNAHLN
jgi:ankyrin repeat protein